MLKLRNNVVTVGNHVFTVGGVTDEHYINIYERLGQRPARSMVLYNSAAIGLWFQISTDGIEWSEPIFMTGSLTAPPYRIYKSDGLYLYALRVWSVAINGAYSMQAFPGEIDKYKEPFEEDLKSDTEVSSVDLSEIPIDAQTL